MAKKRKQPSGSKKMYLLGKKPQLLWYTPEQYALIKAAAAADGRSMANFALHATVKAAELQLAHQVGAKQL